MQDDVLQREIIKNKENVFISKELQSRINPQIAQAKINCVIHIDNKTVKGTVLSQKTSLKKNIFTIDVDKQNLTGLNLSCFKSLVINGLYEFDLENKLKKFSVYLNSNKKYYIKLSLLPESEIKNGI